MKTPIFMKSEACTEAYKYFDENIRPLEKNPDGTINETAQPIVQADSNTVAIGNIVIDKERYLIRMDDEEMILPRKEFELLSLLVSKPGKVFTREEIFQIVWGDKVIVGDRTIDVHIRKLREKIGEECIKTVKGVGYKMSK